MKAYKKSSTYKLHKVVNRKYYKYGDATDLVNLSQSNNTSYITDGTFKVESATHWSTTQTYMLTYPVFDNKVRLDFYYGYSQGNQYVQTTITAKTDIGDVEIFKKDWGYGEIPEGVSDITVDGASVIYGFTIYFGTWRRSTSYCYGGLGVKITKRTINEGSSTNYDYYRDISTYSAFNI